MTLVNIISNVVSHQKTHTRVSAYFEGRSNASPAACEGGTFLGRFFIANLGNLRKRSLLVNLKYWGGWSLMGLTVSDAHGEREFLIFAHCGKLAIFLQL